MKGRFNRFVKFLKPELHIHKDDKGKDKRIEELVRSEENLKTERKSLIQKIRSLERKVESQNKDIKMHTKLLRKL